MTTCASCHEPLEIVIESDEEDIGSFSAHEPQTVPDDVELPCGCHFHWQCLLDSYQIMECPNCKRSVLSTSGQGQEQVLCNLHNEGGLQRGLDILPILSEESYLHAYPEERKLRAFLEFCREGDVEAIIDLLNDEEGEMDEESGAQAARLNSNDDGLSKLTKILNYQDPVGSMYSALHIAVINEKVEIIWLLLYMASNLDIEEFPVEVLEAASQLGAERLFTKEAMMKDIRLLKDSEGLNAYQHAEARGLGRHFKTNLLSPR